MRTAFLLSTTIYLFLPTALLGHGGGTDSLGCHHDRKRGGYHCHSGALAGQSFSTKAEALAALEGRTSASSSEPDTPLPETPAELPKDTITGGRPIPRYDYSEEKDQLTDKITRRLIVRFSMTQEDRGFSDPANFMESLWIYHVTSKSGDTELALALVRSSEDTLGSLTLPSSKFTYRPSGQEAVTVDVKRSDHKIKMASLGEYTEMIAILMSLEQLVESITSPLLRFTGNEHSKDYELTVTDKKAVLWFVENNLPRGKEVVSAVRERLDTLEKSDKN